MTFEKHRINSIRSKTQCSRFRRIAYCVYKTNFFIFNYSRTRFQRDMFNFCDSRTLYIDFATAASHFFIYLHNELI